MEGFILIVIVFGIAALLGKTPSAVHDPAGYNNQQGCMTILSIGFLIGIILMVAKGCK